MIQQVATLPPVLQRLMQEGEQRLGARQYSDAVIALNQVLEAEPNNRTAHLLRGRAHHRLRNYEAAFEDFKAGDPQQEDQVACAYQGLYWSWSKRHPAAI